MLQAQQSYLHRMGLIEEKGPVTIRRCTLEDAAALTALARETFQATFTGTCSEADMLHFLDSVYHEERMKLELAQPHDKVYFACSGGQPVGFIRYLESPLPFPLEEAQRPLELNRLYVLEAQQGRGIAQRLMQTFLNDAQQRGNDYLWLGVWEHNHRAQAFYRKYGFTFSGYTHPFPIGETPQTDEWWTMRISRESRVDSR